MIRSDSAYLFLGVGGMGMAPLACWLSNSGIKIFGFDDALEERTRELLIAAGVQLMDFTFPEHIDSYHMIVYSSAIAPTHTILQAAQARGIPMMRRGEMLAKVSQQKRLIAIVGSHGKTTTSGMIVHMLGQFNYEVNYILGGLFNEPTLKSSNYSTNDWLIAEIDESDGTIDQFIPEVTVLLNADWDHPDYYTSEQSIHDAFASITERTKSTILMPEDLYSHFTDPVNASKVAFAPLDFYQVDPPKMCEINTGNAAAALAVVNHLYNTKLPRSILSSYSGMLRRQQLLHHDVQLSIIDDYAHHPNEIALLLSGLRSQFSEKKLVVVFQPHRFSRTKQFKDAFASILTTVDQLFLLPVYSAYEVPLDGEHIYDLSAVFSESPPETLSMDIAGINKLANNLSEVPTTLAFVGAGDIDEFSGAFVEMTRTRPDPSLAFLQFLQPRVSKGCRLLEHESLANKTTMRIGGSTRFYVEPSNLVDLQAVLRAAKFFQLNIFCLGRGSNLLIPDETFDGLVIRLNASNWKSKEVLENGRIWVTAGVRLKSICGFAAKHGLSGFEFLEGIPGSVGGALRMNAGAMGSWIFDVVERVVLIDSDGNLRDLHKQEFHFGYRKVDEISTAIALGAILKSPLKNSSTQLIRERMDTYFHSRKNSQPREPSAGCIFKNPEGNYAGQLIEEYGIKGMRIGDAEVSSVHGNFIVNRGAATAKDVIDLVKEVRSIIFKKSGYLLEPEVLLLGKSWEDVLGPIEETADDV